MVAELEKSVLQLKTHFEVAFWPYGIQNTCLQSVEAFCILDSKQPMSESQTIRIPATEEQVDFTEDCGMLAAIRTYSAEGCHLGVALISWVDLENTVQWAPVSFKKCFQWSYTSFHQL